MNLNKMLAAAKVAKNSFRKPGRVSDWIKLAKLNLKGSRLQLVETRILGATGEDTVTIEAAPGEYLVDCQTMAFGTDLRISRMRVMLAGTRPVLGKEVGKIAVDAGGIAVVDFDSLQHSIAGHPDEYQEWLEGVLLELRDPVGILDWKPGELKIPYSGGGFGSGSFPVFALMEKSDIVGLEVEFIRSGTGYPFK